MKTRRLDFTDVFLYAVTPDFKDETSMFEKIQKVLKGGVDAIELRTQGLSDKDLVSFGKRVKDVCDQYGALLIVDNRADVALAVDAHGVHLGQLDLPIKIAREILGSRRIIGASTHSLPQALEAQKQGADYVSCGPIWGTPTKPDYPPVGLNLIGLYKAALKVPFVVIGGVDQSNIDDAVKAGTRSLALVRALFDSPDPQGAAQFFKEKIQRSQQE